VLETAKDHDIKDIVFAGDLFHDREKIDILTYHRTYEILKQHVSEDRRLHLLLGNHDIWYLKKCDVSSVVPLREMPGLNVISTPSTVDIAGQPISFLPYTHDPIQDLKLIKNDHSFKVLFGHLAIDGAVLNSSGTQAEVSLEHDGDMIKVDKSIFKGWDQVFLGHYHVPQKLSNKVEYIGSPLQLDFSDAFQEKHIIIFDLKTKEKQYIVNDFSPKHLVIPQKDVEKHNLQNNFVKIIVEDISASDIVDMRTELLKEHTFGSLEIKPVLQKNDKNLVLDAKAILLAEDKMLETYLNEIEKEDGLNGLDKEKLLEIGKSICAGRDK